MTDGDRDPSERLVAIVRRVLPAKPHVVYEEWLDPEALSDWMCPRPARCLKVELEPRVGGAIRLHIEDSDVRFYVLGRFKILDPPNRLRFTWSCSTWPDPTVESVVTVSLTPDGDDCTLMTIEHTLLPPDLVDQHLRGWSAIAEQLDAELSPPGPNN
jgi:uncharacterized protein YndB with AHSA1/START domain